MADETETPATPKPRARRAPRKTSAPKPATVATSEKPTASKTRRKPAAKPAAAVSATPPAAPAASVKKPSAPPKPRSSKRATPAPKRPTKPKTAIPPVEAEKTGGWKSKAAIAGGLAAVGAAATAALLSLRGSTPKKDEDGPAKPLAENQSGAHTADGTDASKSFEAGIADEGVVPE